MAAARKLHVIYAASDREATVKGDFQGMVRVPGEPPLYSPMILLREDGRVGNTRTRAGQTMVIDPRCLVLDVDTGEIVFNPRDHLDLMTEDMRNWMDEHPDWPSSRTTQSG